MQRPRLQRARQGLVATTGQREHLRQLVGVRFKAALRSASAERIASAARTARSASSSCARGSPNTAMIAAG